MTDVTGRQFTVTAIEGDNISVVCYDDGTSYLCSPLCFEGEQSMFIAETLPVDVDDVVDERAPVPPTAATAPTTEQQVLFEHENRILALEGQPPLTVDDFLQKVTEAKTP